MPESPPSALKVRSAQAGDIPSIVDLLVSAPDDATLPIGSPRTTRPGAPGLGPGLLQDPTSLTRIALLDSNVVGFSSWVRRAPDPDDPDQLQRLKISEPLILDAEENQDYSELLPSIEPDKARADAIARVREHLSHISPIQSLPRYSLQGLAVHTAYQGRGIGTLLVRWGLEQGAAEGVPVSTAGEARGVRFYTDKALGFQVVKGSKWWLDRHGQDIQERDVVQNGNREWDYVRGGVSGAQVVWLPPGLCLDIEGLTYRG
ncbi:hypothetical protein PG991_011660 [Apiospora marii]|uniref:N-acetyltransferase domain-containing protein n=1 Tax=Apiospora marii TaxID=335849 RepID=A0ABR1RFT2_9PEZI